jgi:DNA-binding GntR family transcriptional regulator
MDKFEELERIEKFSSYKDKVYQTLKEALLNNVFKPGDMLLERTIAQQLGISRTPVREALKLLEHEGWVETIPWKGVVIKSLSIKEAKDIMQLRIATECFAIGEIAESITDDEIKKLSENLELIKELSDKGNLEGAIRVDTEFHLYFLKILGNEKMIQLHESLGEQIHRYGLRGFRATDRAKQLYEEHATIVNALKDRDKAKAVKAAENHLVNTMKTWNEMQSNENAGASIN